MCAGSIPTAQHAANGAHDLGAEAGDGARFPRDLAAGCLDLRLRLEDVLRSQRLLLSTQDRGLPGLQ